MPKQTTKASGKEASNTGVAGFTPFKVEMDGGSDVSAPILLGGLKLASLHAKTLAATNITILGANFSSKETGGDGDSVDGFLTPNDSDFSPLFDATDMASSVITATTGDKIWSFPDAGFPIWIQIKLSVAQSVTLYLGAKG